MPGRAATQADVGDRVLQGLGHAHSEADVTVPRQGEARLDHIVDQAGDVDGGHRQPDVDMDIIAVDFRDDRVSTRHLAAILQHVLRHAPQLVVLQRLHLVELVGLQELRGIRKCQRKPPRAAVEAVGITLAFDQAVHTNGAVHIV